MKIKLENYSLISNEWIDNKIKYLNSFDHLNNEPMIAVLEQLKRQLIPSIKLAERCYDEGCSEGASNSSYYAADENKKHFLNSEII